MKQRDVLELIDLLRDSQSDTYKIEAKAASHGMPENIDEILSAFGNMPDGGIILLGISEDDGAFNVTGVWDPAEAPAALGKKARERIHPPLQLGAVETFIIERAPVVCCVIPPQPHEFKPFRVGVRGPAFTRSGDGDYQLTSQEEQFLTASAHNTSSDRAPVIEASVDHDLDEDLVNQYLSKQLASSRRLRNSSRDEQIIRTNIAADSDGHPTVAALYALGKHPQQFLPHLALKLATRPAPGSDGVRFIDKQQFAGPVPDLLEQGFDWIQKHLMQAVTFRDGHGYNTPELPPIAIREILANALVHRDLSSASLGRYTQVTKVPGKLIIDNPGGLWGITTRELGRTGPRARNPVLYDMCSAITTSEGRRVIEASATGIPATRQALNDAFLPEPFFKDRVISFQAILSSTSILNQSQMEWLSTLPGAQTLTVAQKHALVAMKDGAEISNKLYREQFPMDTTQARNELQELVSYGLIESVGSGYRLKQTEKSTTPNMNHMSHDEKRQLILDALAQSNTPLDRDQLMALTNMTRGQLAPTLTSLVKDGNIVMMNPSPRARNQRYLLADRSTNS